MKMTRLFLSLFLLLTLTGCLGKAVPVHFYVLASPPDHPMHTDLPAGKAGVNPRQGPRVGILPVSLPGYLQRPQMVLRQGDNVDIRMEDFHRWGEDLGLGMARVLSAVITNALEEEGGVALPLRTGAPVDLRVQLDIRRFEGSPGDTVTLEAVWSIQQDRQPVREGYFIRRAQSQDSLASVVETQSILLEGLGEDIAAGVQTLKKEGSPPQK